jgi:hypothetical protein
VSYHERIVEKMCTNDLPCRYVSRAGGIKLEGDEKALMAEFESSTANLTIDYP